MIHTYQKKKLRFQAEMRDTSGLANDLLCKRSSRFYQSMEMTIQKVAYNATAARRSFDI
jgi:hypothetical protein